MRRKHAFALAALLLLLGAVGLYAAPYVVVWRMRGAVERGDAAALSSHVNFPLLRESLKASLSAARLENVSRQKDPGSSAFGALLAAGLLDRMVDTLVTPEAIARMMRGQKPSAPAPAAQLTPEVATRMGYEGAATFVVSVRHSEQTENFGMVFTRAGLSWQLSAVRLVL